MISHKNPYSSHRVYCTACFIMSSVNFKELSQVKENNLSLEIYNRQRARQTGGQGFERQIPGREELTKEILMI